MEKLQMDGGNLDKKKSKIERNESLGMNTAES